MTNESLEKLTKYLPARVSRTVETADKALRDFALHKKLSHWRPISTAPYNQQLELRFALGGKISTLEFPCLHTNADEWINVDLGSKFEIDPVEWRFWQHESSPEPHHSKLKPSDRSALFRHSAPKI